MAGNAKNAGVWAFADVLIGPVGAAVPADGADFDLTQWDYVGLLSGEDGFAETVEMESADHYAWGGGLIATTRSNYKLTRKFVPYEDNETVFDLVYPGHSVSFADDGTFSGDIHLPDLQAKFKIAFETRIGDTVKRTISANYAQISELGEALESAAELAKREITVAIYPSEPDDSGNAALFHTWKGQMGVDAPAA